jgi:hypothetical protein
MKSSTFLVATLLCGCQSVWGSLSIPNPENCVASPTLCLADEVCDSLDQLCHPALAMYAVNPNQTPTSGGGSVRILGERFLPGVEVLWQDQKIPSVQYVSSIELSFSLPASKDGAWWTPIALRNPTGQTVKRTDLFSYYSEAAGFSLDPFKDPRSAKKLTTGDFNSDGKVDIAFVAGSEPTIVIGLGQGDGTLHNVSYLTIGNAAQNGQDILSTDTDGDGTLDLIVSASGSVYSFRGDGKGGFVRGPSILTGSRPEQLIWTKRSASPQRTLMVTDGTDQTLSLVNIQNDGSYERGKVIVTGTFIVEAVSCDTSGDGIDELYWVDTSGQLHVAQAAGSGEFALNAVPAASCVANGLTCRDLNQDGRPDLLLSCSKGLLPIYGSSTGLAVGNLLEAGRSPSSHVLAEDISGDGWPDILFGDKTQNASLVMLSNRQGGYLSPAVIDPSTVGMGQNSVVYQVADMDGDHKPDVLIATPFALSPSTVQIALNRSR